MFLFFKNIRKSIIKINGREVKILCSKEKNKTIGIVDRFRRGHRGVFVELKALAEYGFRVTISLKSEKWEDGFLPVKEGQVVVVGGLIRNRKFWEASNGRLFLPSDEEIYDAAMMELGIEKLFKSAANVEEG